MYLYFRICEKQSTNGLGTRWKNTPKLEILKKCWLSLQPGLEATDKVILINDHCSSELVEWLTKTSKANVKDSPVPDHEGRPEFSFMHCAKELKALAKFLPREIHYVCEDDYLHDPEALLIAKHLFKDNGWQGFAILYDYPDRYSLDRLRTCELMVNEDSHWRTVPSSTGCLMADGQTWTKWMTIFEQSAKNNSDTFTWHAFANTPCLSPVPGLATHLTEGCMSPLRDWESLWNSIKIED